MIRIKKTDNLFDVINKIQKNTNNEKKIILEFPFWHHILYNKVALQSIKNIIGDKKVIIATSDILSKKIWKKLWFKYSIIKNSNFIEQKDLLKYNYSFFEYFKYEIRKLITIFLKSQKPLDPRKHFLKYYKQKTHISIFISILILAILIFFYIFFFALSKTYVYITPDIQVKTKAHNFIFEENKNIKNNKIELIPFSQTINIKKIIKTTWIKQDNKYIATWKVEFINKLTTEIKLLPKTRLESKNWIIYETKYWVNIPPAIKNKAWTLIPWKKEVEIIAKLKDKNWEISGIKSNIKRINTILILPWLKKEDQKNIFARTLTEISWWNDIFIKILWKDDLKNSKQIFIQNLKKEAIKKLQKQIFLKNKESNITYQILKIDNIYEFTDINIILPELNIWDEIESFIIEWEITVKTYAFNISSVISKLKSIIEKSLLSEKEKLLDINNNSINIYPKIWIIYRLKNPLRIKATLEVEYNIEYNFKDQNNNYINRLKQIISWIDKEKAENILINEQLISNASIDIRPFFINKVSKYFKNIDFIVED